MISGSKCANVTLKTLWLLRKYPKNNQEGTVPTTLSPEESSEFTRKVLENTGVIVVPGWGFGATLQQAVRLSYGPLVDDLDKRDEAMRRTGTFLNR